MAGTAVETDQRLIAFMLPSIPESARIARFRIRAALGFHDLGHLADDAEIITSELVTNAVQHACGRCHRNDPGNPRADTGPALRDRRRVGLLATRPGDARAVGRQRARPGAPDRSVAIRSLGLAP